MSRILAIGDIHGCFRALTALEAFVPFKPDDLIITLGDYVDRGPDSRQVIDWLVEREQTGLLIPLKGNHELLMLGARETKGEFDWLAVGGAATLRSYSRDGGRGSLEDVPPEHWHFMESVCRPWYETQRHLFVHANAYADMLLIEQPDFMLFWERFEGAAPHMSGKKLICGHTAQISGEPLHLGHATCIDTWACGRGWLTCLDVDRDIYWQANSGGQTRRGRLQSM